jgi:hypothetical protein
MGIDSHAEFLPEQPLYVRCSSCCSEVRMRSLYSTKNFKTHRKSKKCTDERNKLKGSFQPSLFGYLQPARKVAGSQMSGISPKMFKPTIPLLVLCPGLTAKFCPKSGSYMRRSAAPGGGAPSRSKIAKILFGPDVPQWRNLDEQRRNAVLRMEANRYLWVNHRHLGAVFSTACEGEVMVSSVDEDPSPCSKCESLLHLHAFQVQLNRPMPAEKNMKFVPKIYRDEALGSLYLQIKGVRELVEEVSLP